ncbi:MAG: hypothetical protein AAF587_31310 [Bacteroidota bacterium]
MKQLIFSLLLSLLSLATHAQIQAIRPSTVARMDSFLHSINFDKATGSPRAGKDQASDSSRRVIIGPCHTSLPAPKTPLLLLNGELLDFDQLSTIKLEQIKEMYFATKDDPILALFGSHAQHGILFIHTKKSDP